MLEPPSWAGDKLYFLAIAAGEKLTLVDLDEPGWVTKHADLLTAPGVWHLVAKADSHIPFSMVLSEGEKGYCLIRHIGVMGAVRTEVQVYGIGKRRVDGHNDRLWVLPNGQVCGGDDAEPLAKALLRSGYGQPRTLARTGQPAQIPQESSDMNDYDKVTKESEHETGSTSVDKTGVHDATATGTAAKSTTGRVEDQTVETPEPGHGTTTGRDEE